MTPFKAEIYKNHKNLQKNFVIYDSYLAWIFYLHQKLMLGHLHGRNRLAIDYYLLNLHLFVSSSSFLQFWLHYLTVFVLNSSEPPPVALQSNRPLRIHQYFSVRCLFLRYYLSKPLEWDNTWTITWSFKCDTMWIISRDNEKCDHVRLKCGDLISSWRLMQISDHSFLVFMPK